MTGLLPRREQPPEADIRPSLLGIVTLLFLLLFFLLSTSTGQRLAAVNLRLGSAADLAPVPHTGLVKDLAVQLSGGSAALVFEVQTTDIAASATSVERRTLRVPPAPGGGLDLVGLARAVEQVKAIDPSQERAQLEPADDVTTADLLRAMDVLRGAAGAPLYPKLALGGA